MPVADGTPAPEMLARGATSAPPPPLRHRTITPPPASMPVAAPFEPREVDDMFAAPAAEPVAAEKIEHNWFQSSRLLQNKQTKKTRTRTADHDKSSGTIQVPRATDTVTLAKKLVVPTAALVLVGVCVGGYFAFDGEGGKKSHAAKPTTIVAAADTTKPGELAKPVDTATAEPAKTEAAKTEPATTPAKTEPATTPAKTEPAMTPAKTEAKTETKSDAAKPLETAAVSPALAAADVKPAPPNQANMMAATTTTIKTTRGEVKLVDIRIDSTPSGATVMLVDRGKTTFLGNTPISTAVDTSRTYDFVFTAANHPTQVEHLDPHATQHMAVVLGKPGNTAAPSVTAVAAVAPTPPAEHHHHHTAAAARVAAAPEAHQANAAASAPAKKSAIIDPFATTSAPAASSSSGTLMVSSKPPCEILVDGKDTGLMTPQRSIPLAAGAHKVTFVNASQAINKTVAVKIEPDKPTKLIQDLMKK